MALTLGELAPKLVDPSWLLSVLPGSRAGAVLERVLGGADWPQIAERLRPALERLGELDLDELLVACWKKGRDVADACATTQGNPDIIEQVQLYDHTVAIEHEPSIIVRFEEMTVAELELRIVLTLEFKAAILVIERGGITGLQLGSLQGRVRGELEGVECFAYDTPVLTPRGKATSRRTPARPRAAG